MKESTAVMTQEELEKRISNGGLVQRNTSCGGIIVGMPKDTENGLVILCRKTDGSGRSNGLEPIRAALEQLEKFDGKREALVNSSGKCSPGENNGFCCVCLMNKAYRKSTQYEDSNIQVKRKVLAWS